MVRLNFGVCTIKYMEYAKLSDIIFLGTGHRPSVIRTERMVFWQITDSKFPMRQWNWIEPIDSSTIILVEIHAPLSCHFYCLAAGNRIQYDRFCSLSLRAHRLQRIYRLYKGALNTSVVKSCPIQFVLPASLKYFLKYITDIVELISFITHTTYF